jgi:hypothetical protein
VSAIAGTWDLALRTPIGTLRAEYRFEQSADGLHGTAKGPEETVPLANITTGADPAGERVTWQQRVTKPIRLNLAFEVVVTGDTLTGHSRAGRLPRTRVTGRRVPT